MSVRFEDRKSTYPGRYKATKTDGTSEYLTLERADEPTVEGTPLNAATLNAVVRGHTPRNLLDNSDFTNPVNQRGKTSYTDAGYTIDRWTKNPGVDLSVKADGITLSQNATGGNMSFFQKLNDIKKYLGKTMTFAVSTDKGIYVKSATLPTAYPSTTTAYAVTINDVGTFQLMLTNETTGQLWALIAVKQTVKIYWAALYEGEYTLDTLPEYQPKGYAVELAECQRYYYKAAPVTNGAFIGDTGNSSKNIRFHVPTPVPMRADKPTVSFGSTTYVITGDATVTIGKPESVIGTTNGNFVYVTLPPLETAIGSVAYALCAVQAAMVIAADL